MSELYLVTTEAEDDGSWWDDPPCGFDSEQEAREHASKMPSAPAGYCRVLYRCKQVDVLESGEPRTPQFGVVY